MLIFRYIKEIKSDWRTPTLNNVLRLMYSILLLTVLFTVAFKFFEAVSWEEAIWQAWQTFTTVGYGNQPATTTAGRIITMLFSTLGIAFVGTLFSALFDYRQYFKEKIKSGRMKNLYENGYVIFNFPGVAITKNLISEWRTMEPEVPVCIVDERLEQLPNSLENLGSVHFVKGGTLSKETYEKATLKKNKAVIIFPMDPHSKDTDGATKTIVELVSMFTDTNTRILHLLVAQENAWMFENTRSVQILSDLEVLAVVQECQDPYSSEIIETLLLNTKGANPQTFSADPLEGRTWGELLGKVSDACKTSGQVANLFALIQDNKSNVCPDPTVVIQKGDYISVIAYPKFKWDLFVKAL